MGAPKGSEDDVPIPSDVMEKLRDAALVCEDDGPLRQKIYRDMAAAAADPRDPIFVVLPSSYCNMGCAYCGQEHVKGGLSPEAQRRVVARVEASLSQAPAPRRVRVRWFGGEPLMGFATIRTLSKDLTALADDHGVAYESNIVTNGALLDERKLRCLVNECRVREFHITLDGPAEVHDRHRPLKSGKPSFDRLTTFLADMARRPEYGRVRWILRTNIDVANSEHIDAYFEHMAARGFNDAPNVLFSLVAVHPWGNDVSHLELSRRAYAEAELRWLERLSSLGLRTILLPSARKSQVCGAVNQHSEVIAPDGQIHSCTEKPLVPSYAAQTTTTFLGDIGVGDRRPADEYDEWHDEVARGEVPCSTCWLLPVCGGSCPKAWHEGYPPCPSMKLNMSGRLDIAMRQMGHQRVLA
jgi:uncharacterized protein